MLKISPPSQQSSVPSNATFDQPLELLQSCHEKILHFSSALVTLSTTLQQTGWTEPLQTSAEQIRRYFNIAGPEHHQDEEQHLFPAIIALDPEFKQPDSLQMVQVINGLIQEHVETDTLWEALDTLLAKQSQEFAAIEEFSQQFAADMREHVQLENEVIFPFVKNHFSEKQLKEMGTAIAKRRGVK